MGSLIGLLHETQSRPHPPTPYPQLWGKGSLKVPLPRLEEGFRERASRVMQEV